MAVGYTLLAAGTLGVPLEGTRRVGGLLGPGSQASSRGEAKDSALLSSRDAGHLEPPERAQGNEYSGLISFRMDRLGLLAVQGTLKSLLHRPLIEVTEKLGQGTS